MRNDVEKNKEKNFVSAVIYVYNSEKQIKNFLKTIIEVLEENFEHSEIICVNDSSDDNSLNVIKEAGCLADTTSVTVINMSYFHGLESAMNAGTDMAIGDFVFEFDNTCLDFERSAIMMVYRHSLEGFDMVSASPDIKEKFTSRLFYKSFGHFTTPSYKMGTESFRVLSRRIINRIGSMTKTIPYRKAVYTNCGLKTDNIKYTVIDHRKSRLDKKERSYRVGLAVDSLILFTNIGYRFSLMMTIIMMLMSIFMLVYSLLVYLVSQPVAGWTTTILFLSVAFLGLFGVLTIIIKYLQLLLKLVFNKKSYSFESIEKLTKQ